MASQQSAEGEPGALQRSVLLQGLAGIMRATWNETAIAAEQRAQQILVTVNQPDQETRHVYVCLLLVRSQLIDQVKEFRFNVGVIFMRKGFLRPDQYVNSTQNMMFVPEQFTQYALHVIPLYGSSRRFLSDNQTQSGMFQCIRHVMHDQDLARNALAEIKNG
jgi:hypothetical protein